MIPVVGMDTSNNGSEKGAKKGVENGENGENGQNSGNGTASSDVNVIISTREDKKESRDPPLTLLASTFKEASLDTPSFRASANYIHEQMDQIDRWLDGFIKATARMANEMEIVQEAANGLVSKFMPPFVSRGVVDHDHTALVMRRYAEGTQHYWTSIITRVKSHTTRAVNLLTELQRTHMRAYQDVRRHFEATQARFDGALARYQAMSKHKEPSALREDAFQVAEARKGYTRASFDLCCATATCQHELDMALVDALTHGFLLRSGGTSDDPFYHTLGIDMHRVRAWSKAVASSLEPLKTEMLKVRREMEVTAFARFAPSRDLNDYTLQTASLDPASLGAGAVNPSISSPAMSSAGPATITSGALGTSGAQAASGSVIAEKHGWLLVRTSVPRSGRPIWTRRWAFVKDGVFGWLQVAPSGLFVQESDRIGVLLCNVAPEPAEDRRFCFEVRTKDATLVLQAESLGDMRAWMQVFDIAKRQVLLRDRQSDVSFAFERSAPPVTQLASEDSTVPLGVLTHNNHGRSVSMDGAPTPATPGSLPGPAGTVPGPHTPRLQETADLLTLPASQTLLDSLAGHSTLVTPGASGASTTPALASAFSSVLTTPILPNVPMPTAMTAEAIVASAYLAPTLVPAATTANVWGALNWSLYQKPSTQLSLDPSGPIPAQMPGPVVAKITLEPFPERYPPELRASDAQMRAIFQTLVDNDPRDRVVTTFRALVSPNPKQELPAKMFLTPLNMYVYSNKFGFVGLVKKRLSNFVSCEGHASTSWDTLYLLDDEGSSALCRVFLDSGRIIQKRIQYLIDLQSLGQQPPLQEVIERLQKLGQRKDVSESKDKEEEKEKDKDSFSDQSDDDSTSRALIQRYMQYRGDGEPTNDKARDSSATAAATTPGASNLHIDLGAAMDYKLVDAEFDVPPKALFHILFGDKSPAFTTTEVSLATRKNIQILPWQLSETRKLEREIKYDVEVRGILLRTSRSKLGRTCCIQRIEKLEDNTLYVVSERRTPWDLPHGDSVFTLFRYVVCYNTTRARSKLLIYANIEWVRAAHIVKAMVESVIRSIAQEESRAVLAQVRAGREKLGKRGMTVTAIRLFGRLYRGTRESSTAVTTTTPSSDLSDPLSQTNVETPPTGLTVSYLHFLFSVTFFALTRCLEVLSSVVALATRGVMVIWQSLTVHRLLLLLLAASCVSNLFLVERTAVSFWAERRAYNLVNRELRATPDSHTVMRRAIYQAELNELIQSGTELASQPQGLCYDRFRSVAAPSQDLDLTDLDMKFVAKVVDVDRASLEAVARIQRLRNDVGIRRNKLLVNLRVLNRIEREILEAEWDNWLLQEIHMCTLANNRISSKKNASYPPEELLQLVEYCDSCRAEYARSYETSAFIT